MKLPTLTNNRHACTHSQQRRHQRAQIKHSFLYSRLRLVYTHRRDEMRRGTRRILSSTHANTCVYIATEYIYSRGHSSGQIYISLKFNRSKHNIFLSGSWRVEFLFAYCFQTFSDSHTTLAARAHQQLLSRHVLFALFLHKVLTFNRAW